MNTPSTTETPAAESPVDVQPGSDLAEVATAEVAATAAAVQARQAHDRRQMLMTVLLLIVCAWTFVFNMLVKEQTPVQAFFKIMDTISDDFVLGSTLTIGVGCGIVAVFSLTKLYSQIMANVYSFRILEEIMINDLGRGRFRETAIKLLNFRDQPKPEGACPTRIWSLLLSLSFIYLVSWIYLLLFSEALFFVSWSAGVDLAVNHNTLIQMPMLALSIPFSARVMAYLRYPYAQDYADFMPGAVFVLLLVASLGFLFESTAQQFYLKRVFDNREYAAIFLKNGVFLAFIPVFFEVACWTIELSRKPAGEEPPTAIS